jgi:hypothetical protein
MFKPGIMIAVVALLATACAGRPGTATVYKPLDLFGGYRDKSVSTGVWKVGGYSNGIAERGFGRNMAIYRAAEIVKSAGYSHFEIIDQKGIEQFIGIGLGQSKNYAGEDIDIVVRGKNENTPPSECLSKNANACFTLNADEVMSRIAPLLTFPKNDPRYQPKN